MGDERRTMKTNLKKILALLLVIAMLLSATGCSYVLLGCAAISCASCAKDHQSQIKDDIGSSVEDVQDAVSDLGDLFSNIVGDKPTLEAEILPKAPGLAAANEAFLALDREIFVWYVTSDITTLDQYCYDPTSFGIDESTVPVTLGDFSPEADAEWIADCRSWLEKLRALDAENLGDQNRFAYDNYVRYFENEIASDGLYYYYEPLAETVGLQVNLPLTFGLYEFKDKQDVENYLTLLADGGAIRVGLLQHLLIQVVVYLSLGLDNLSIGYAFLRTMHIHHLSPAPLAATQAYFASWLCHQIRLGYLALRALGYLADYLHAEYALLLHRLRQSYHL